MMKQTILSAYNDSLEKSVRGKSILTVTDSRLQAVSYDMLTLDEKACRAAACLKGSGCEKGDHVLISVRETTVVWSFFWGALKLGAVPCVLFPELGMKGLETRLNAADASFLVTDADPGKLCGSVRFPETLKKVILPDRENSTPLFVHYAENEWEPVAAAADIDPDDAAFIVFTSGTTGVPKPVVHRHGIAAAVDRSMRGVLHASLADLYWCTAHPAWITGTVYGILGPVICGIPSVQYEGRFHAKRWMPILQDQKITLWYTAPTALRGLMREEQEFFESFDFSALKQVYSIGEPLSVKEYEWGLKTFRQPIYDTWFQTECGTIRIANQPGMKIIPGWMGKAVDDTVIIDPVPDERHGQGELCLNAGFSSMFCKYYGMDDAFRQKVSGNRYDTGDLVSVNEEGYVHFEGRADDVINTSGHLVGPVEVEQVLLNDPAVTAAAVVAEKDELLYEAPAAFLVLAEGQEWNRQLETSLKVAVNAAVSAYAVPKHFYLTDELPQTPGGKINRAELRRRLSIQPVT